MIDKRIIETLRDGRALATVYRGIARKREQYDNLISKQDAAYILAAEKKIDLFKYLDTQSIERIREIMSKKESTPESNTRHQNPESKPKRIRKPKKLILQIDEKVLPPGILSPNLAKEAKDMAEVYPIFYVLENSIRYLIISKLEAAFGTDWWDLAIISTRIKTSAQKIMNEELQNKWYRPRGDHPIFYTKIKQLSNIISSNWVYFKDVGLSSPQWVEFHIDEILEPPRNTIMHCNPLSKQYIRRLYDVFNDWMNILEGQI